MEEEVVIGVGVQILDGGGQLRTTHLGLADTIDQFRDRASWIASFAAQFHSTAAAVEARFKELRQEEGRVEEVRKEIERKSAELQAREEAFKLLMEKETSERLRKLEDSAEKLKEEFQAKLKKLEEREEELELLGRRIKVRAIRAREVEEVEEQLAELRKKQAELEVRRVELNVKEKQSRELEPNSRSCFVELTDEKLEDQLKALGKRIGEDEPKGKQLEGKHRAIDLEGTRLADWMKGRMVGITSRESEVEDYDFPSGTLPNIIRKGSIPVPLLRSNGAPSTISRFMSWNTSESPTLSGKCSGAKCSLSEACGDGNDIQQPENADLPAQQLEKSSSDDQEPASSKKSCEPQECAMNEDNRVPYIGMKFDSDDKAYAFYTEYAGNVGFSVRMQHIKRTPSGQVKRRTFCCSKQGKKAVDKRREHVTFVKPISRVGCLAHMTCLLKSDGMFEIVSFKPDHNHELASTPTKHVDKRISDINRELATWKGVGRHDLADEACRSHILALEEEKRMLQESKKSKNQARYSAQQQPKDATTGAGTATPALTKLSATLPSGPTANYVTATSTTHHFSSLRRTST